MGSIWVQILQQTKIFRALGPLITVIEHMFWDLFRIIIIFLLVSFLFFFVGIHFFNNLALFSSVD